MGSSRASPRTTSTESTASTAAAAFGCPTVSGASASTATTGGSPGAKLSGGWPSTEASACSADENCEKKDSPGNIPREPRPCDSSTSKSCTSAGGATEARERSRSSRSRQRLGTAWKRSTRCCLRPAHRASFEASTRSADAMTVRSHSSKNLAASKICSCRGTLPSQHIFLCTSTRPHHDIHAGDRTVLASLHPHHSATLEPRHDPLRRGGSLHTHRHETPPAHIERIWPGLRLANSAEPEGTQLYLVPLNSLRDRQAPLQLLRGGLQSSGKFNKTRGQVMVFGPGTVGVLS